jgi:DNA polymerase I-like protein with 3'-5' exonuclease and polymerase domains
LAKLRHIAGPQAKLMAPETFAQAFVDRGLQVPLTPKTKKPSIKGPWLAAHANDELAAAILEGRKVETIINTFIDGHINTHAIGGRIHCQFNQLKGEDGGTIARFSSSNPNLQNLPARDEELGPLVRGLFIPEDGETWERHDESQIEYRLLVHFAIGPKADEARKAYRDDPKTDFHKMCAEFCGIDPEDKVARKRVKGVNFGKTYGAGAPKLAAIIGCSLQEAEEFIQLYDEKLPFQSATLNAAMKWAEKQGFVSTILGRKQRFLLWEPMGYGHDKPPMRESAAREAYGPRIKRYKTYAALNRKLQGSGADLMKKAMVDIAEAGILSVLGAPLLTVHDELDYSVPQTAAGREAAAEAKRLMEQAVPLKVPVYVEASSGKDWGQAS